MQLAHKPKPGNALLISLTPGQMEYHCEEVVISVLSHLRSTSGLSELIINPYPVHCSQAPIQNRQFSLARELWKGEIVELCLYIVDIDHTKIQPNLSQWIYTNLKQYGG